MKSSFVFVLSLQILLGINFVWSSVSAAETDLKATKTDDETEDVPAQAEPAPDDAASRFKDERQNLMQVLAKEIAPNLPAKDIEKLQRAVQRLGSCRAEWSSSAQSLLVANAPVAELILYRYAFFKNKRLNSKILSTLGLLESLRFPRAALAFAELLGTDVPSKVQCLKVLERALNQEPGLGPDALTFIASPWGQEIPLEEKLRFFQQTCSVWRKTAPQAMEWVSRWSSEAQSFWAKLLSQEVAACLKGL